MMKSIVVYVIITTIMILLLLSIIIIGSRVAGWRRNGGGKNLSSSTLKNYGVRAIKGLSDEVFTVRELYRQPILGNQTVGGLGSKTVVGIPSYWDAIYSLDDIMAAMTENGYPNKTTQDLRSQISVVNATAMGNSAFDYGYKYRGLKIPLSDGVSHQIDAKDAFEHSISLNAILQVVLSILPNASIVIYYFGADPGTSGAPERGPISKEEYSGMIRRLLREMMDRKGSLDILCFTELFMQTSMRQEVYDALEGLRDHHDRPLTILSRMPTVTEPGLSQLYPCGFTNVLNIGGHALSSTTSPGSNTAYEYPGGGFSSPMGNTTNHDSTQVGVVPQGRGVGTPDVVANVRNLGVYFFGDRYRYQSMKLSPAVYAGVLGCINEVSETSGWDYRDLFYRYSNCLFDPITTGSNGDFRCSDYTGPWNPCTGLGVLRGDALASILQKRFIMSGDYLQISSTAVSREMSYLNFFPISPLEDPLTIQPQHDRYNTLPSFGPQTVWSRLKIYPVDRSTNKIIGLVENDDDPRVMIHHGDAVVLMYHDTSKNASCYLLEVLGNMNVRLHSYPQPALGSSPIDSRYHWTIALLNDNNKNTTGSSIPIQWMSRCSLTPSTDPNIRLCSRYSKTPNLFGSSPSVQRVPEDDGGGTLSPSSFVLCPHPWDMTTESQEEISIESSYFINLTNYREFWSCGVSATEDDTASLLEKRYECINHNVTPVYDRRFDEIPQWMLIPLSGSTRLRYGKFMIFNTRMRAYLKTDIDSSNHSSPPPSTARLVFANIQSDTYGPDVDVYPYCVFDISGTTTPPTTGAVGEDEEDALFRPRRVHGTTTSLNRFLCPANIQFRSPYYNHYYSFLISESSSSADGLQLLPIQPDGYRATTFLFLVDPWKMTTMVRENGAITLSVPPTDANRASPTTSRFIEHAITTGRSNDFVAMVPMSHHDDENDIKRLWTFEARGGVPIVSTKDGRDDDHGGAIPVLRFDPHNDPSTFALKSVKYPDQYLIYYSPGGWQPRLGYLVSDRSRPGYQWMLYPNYLNHAPSDSANNLNLSGNYLYSSLYFINSLNAGVLTCSVPTSHAPQMLSEITNENVDTTYFTSSFLIMPPTTLV